MNGQRARRGKSNGTDHVARLALARANAATAGKVGRNVFTANDVYINALAGSDSADGLTPSTAWKSNAALGNAIGVYGLISPAIDSPNQRWLNVHYQGAIPDDLLNVQAVLDENVCMRFLGADLVTHVHVGTVASAVPYGNSNTLASITDPAIADWTVYVNRRITWTGGAAVGAHAWIADDLGSNTARVSQPGILRDVVLTGLTYPQLVDPSSGTYTIDALPTLYLGVFDIQATGNGDQIEPFVNFVDLNMASTGPIGADPNPTGGATNFVLQGCSSTWQEIQNASVIACVSSFPNGILCGRAADLAMLACIVNTLCAVLFGTLAIDGYTLGEACGFVAGSSGTLFIGTCAVENAVTGAVLNANGDGISSSPGGFGAGFVLTGHSYVSGVSSSIVGTSNAGVGWRVARGRTDVVATVPLVTGTGGDFALDVDTTAVGFDVATGAYATSAIACSWAHLAAAFGGAGFGGGAHDPSTNTHLVGPSAS